MKEYLNDNGEALHCIYRLKDLDGARFDFTSEDKYLQGALMKMDAGKSFRNHKHIKCERHTDMTQETWVIIRGSVQVDYYNEDAKFMGTEILTDGDCTITFAGGHKYSCIKDDTIVYEFKNGPYFGPDADKVLIDD